MSLPTSERKALAGIHESWFRTETGNNGTVGRRGTLKRLSFGGLCDFMATVSMKPAARYAGTELDVHYDPQNPTHSALEIDENMVLDGRASLVVGLVSLAIAYYADFH